MKKYLMNSEHRAVPQLHKPQEAGTRAPASHQCNVRDRLGKHQREQTL